MEKFKEKIASLRAEAEIAAARADEYESQVKRLENEHISKGHELASLQNRVKVLETQLETAEQQLKLTSQNFTEADLKAENAERTVTQLEQNLADQEAKYEDLFEKHKVLMAEAEEMNRQIDDF